MTGDQIGKTLRFLIIPAVTDLPFGTRQCLLGISIIRLPGQLLLGLGGVAVVGLIVMLALKVMGFLLRLALVAFVLAAAWWYLAPALGLPPIPL